MKEKSKGEVEEKLRQEKEEKLK